MSDIVVVFEHRYYKGRLYEKKVAVLLDFVQMRGGGPCPTFFHLFISAFLVYKRSLFPPKRQ